MGTLDRNIYKPAIGEVGWGEEANDNWSRLADVGYNAKAYGVTGDGTTDDTAAIQALLDTFDPGAGVEGATILFPTGSYRITSTLFLNRNAHIIKGQGSQGNTTNFGAFAGNGTTFRWDGAAGQDMFNITDSKGIHFEDIFFQGNSTNVPSELIYFESAGGSQGSNEQLTFKRCSFGAGSWTSPTTTASVTATYAVRFGGTNANNDQFHFEDCVFFNVGTGIKLDNSQSVWGQMTNCFFNSCTVAGIQTAATVNITNATFNRCTKDFVIDSTARVTVSGYYSEHSGQLVQTTNVGSFYCFGGFVLLQAEMGTEFMDFALIANGGSVHLVGLKVFDQIAGSANLKVRSASASGDGYVKIEGGEGYGLSSLDIQGPASGTNKVWVDIDSFGVKINRSLAAGVTLSAASYEFPVESVVVGGGAALATTATDGFLYIPTCAGTPTGVPTTKTGSVAMVFDTSNNRLYAYDAGWVNIGTTT